MVVERLVRAVDLERDPMMAFFLAIALGSLAILVSSLFFQNYTSLIMIFFVALGISPLLEKIFAHEEKQEEMAHGIRDILKRNKPVIEIYFYFFIGLVVTYFFWFFAMGQNSQQIFLEQIRILRLSPSLIAGPSSSFLKILSNNVLIFTVFFIISLLYTTGSIVVLAWNASVFSTLLAYTMRGLAYKLTSFAIVGVYFLHAIPEFSAYFLAANAGAILSISIIKKRHARVGWNNILKDVTLLLLIGYLVLILAALIEVNVSSQLISAFR